MQKPAPYLLFAFAAVAFVFGLTIGQPRDAAAAISCAAVPGGTPPYTLQTFAFCTVTTVTVSGTSATIASATTRQDGSGTDQGQPPSYWSIASSINVFIDGTYYCAGSSNTITCTVNNLSAGPHQFQTNWVGTKAGQTMYTENYDGFTVVLPNLTVSSISYSGTPTVNQPLAIQAVVTNNGSATAGSSSWAQTAVGPVGGSAAIGGFSVPALGAGSSSTGSFSYTPTTAGAHSINVCADVNSNVLESNEAASDNCRTISMTVSAPPASPVTVDLKGEGADGPLTIGFRQSIRLSWTSANATSCSLVIPGMSPFAQDTVGSLVTVPFESSGTVSLTCTGSGGTTGSDTLVVNVIPAPTPSISNTFAAPSTITRGDYLTITVVGSEFGASPGALGAFEEMTGVGGTVRNSYVQGEYNRWDLTWGPEQISLRLYPSVTQNYTPGVNTIYVRVANQFGQRSNVYAVTATVSSAPPPAASQPNLTVSSVTSTGTTTTGSPLTFQAVVTNNGLVSAGPSSWAQTVLSLVGGAAAPGSPNGFTVPALGAGQSYTTTYIYAVSTAGTYSANVCVDVNRQVNESNETDADNCRTISVNVTAAGGTPPPTTTGRAVINSFSFTYGSFTRSHPSASSQTIISVPSGAQVSFTGSYALAGSGASDWIDLGCQSTNVVTASIGGSIYCRQGANVPYRNPILSNPFAVTLTNPSTSLSNRVILVLRVSDSQGIQEASLPIDVLPATTAGTPPPAPATGSVTFTVNNTTAITVDADQTATFNVTTSGSIASATFECSPNSGYVVLEFGGQRYCTGGASSTVPIGLSIFPATVTFRNMVSDLRQVTAIIKARDASGNVVDQKQVLITVRPLVVTGTGSQTQTQTQTQTQSQTQAQTQAQTTIGSSVSRELFRAQNDDRVFVVVNNQRLWIPDTQTFQAAGYQWSNVRVVPETQVQQYSRLRLARGGSDARVYYITESGLRRHIPSPEAFTSYGNRWENVVSVGATELGAYRDVRFVHLDGDSRVYLLENGQKRWVKTAEAFQRLGGRWDQIAPVNATEFAAYSLGSDIE